MSKRQRVEACSRDGRDDSLFTNPCPRRAKLNMAGSTIPAMVDHIKEEGRYEVGSRDAHPRLTHPG